MELNDHMRIIRKNSRFIIIFTVLATLAAFLFTYLSPIKYDSSISFSVKRINKQPTPYYDDNYFGIQASDLFSQTVISWFLTPSVLLDIYDQAGIDPKINSLTTFVNRFKTKKYSAQNIVVRFSERDEATSNKISQAITNIMEKKAGALNQNSENKAMFEIDGEKPVIVRNNPKLILNTVAGFIAGLVISFMLVYLFRYFKPSSEPEKM